MDAAFCASKASQWGIFPELATAYLEHVFKYRYFATAIMLPMSMPSATGRGDVTGMLVATSSAGSIRNHQQNFAEHHLGAGIENRDWKAMDVYFFEDLAFLNFNGMRDPEYKGYKLAVSFGEYLEEASQRKGIPFFALLGGALPPLRAQLEGLGVQYWAEITVGSSFHEYRALDAYVRISGAGIEKYEQAHFVLNTQKGPRYRVLMMPEDWWMCDSWVSVGQQGPNGQSYSVSARRTVRHSRL